VIERWPAVVGEGIARNAWPARIARDGTLLVNTADSVWAFELTQRAAEIAGRLDLPAVRFAPGPLAGSSEPPKAPPAPEPSAAQERAAAAIAATIQDPNLRKTVQRAVSLSLAREPVDRPV
jgi:Dna[CI] antecedent, DciA